MKFKKQVNYFDFVCLCMHLRYFSITVVDCSVVGWFEFVLVSLSRLSLNKNKTKLINNA